MTTITLAILLKRNPVNLIALRRKYQKGFQTTPTID
jgi:hypothetical protein